MTMNDVKLEGIMSVYSGRNERCCCGCSGKHTYASAHQKAAGKHRGYAVTDDEVSDRSVKIVFNKFIKNAGNVEFHKDSHAALVIGTRFHVLYFVPSSN